MCTRSSHSCFTQQSVSVSRIRTSNNYYGHLPLNQKFSRTNSKKRNHRSDGSGSFTYFLTPSFPSSFTPFLFLQPPDSDPTPFHRGAIPRDQVVAESVGWNELADAEARTRAHWCWLLLVWGCDCRIGLAWLEATVMVVKPSDHLWFGWWWGEFVWI